MKKLNLTPKIILEKKFTTEMSGYSAAEVDSFFDMIIEDYQKYQEEIKLLESKLEEKVELINDKDDEVERLRIEISNLKLQLKESSKVSGYEIMEQIKSLKNSNNKD